MPVSTVNAPVAPEPDSPVVSAMSPLTPEEPELAVAIVMEPESSEVPTPLVTLTAPPVFLPDATRDGHGATHSPAAAITDASRQRQRASARRCHGGLASRHGHRPAGAGVAIPHAQAAPPAPPVALPVSTVNAPVAPEPDSPVVSAMSPLTPEEPELAVAIVMEPESSESRRRSSHSRRRPC